MSLVPGIYVSRAAIVNSNDSLATSRAFCSNVSCVDALATSLMVIASHNTVTRFSLAGISYRDTASLSPFCRSQRGLPELVAVIEDHLVAFFFPVFFLDLPIREVPAGL